MHVVDIDISNLVSLVISKFDSLYGLILQGYENIDDEVKVNVRDFRYCRVFIVQNITIQSMPNRIENMYRMDFTNANVGRMPIIENTIDIEEIEISNNRRPIEISKSFYDKIEDKLDCDTDLLLFIDENAFYEEQQIQDIRVHEGQQIQSVRIHEDEQAEEIHIEKEKKVRNKNTYNMYNATFIFAISGLELRIATYVRIMIDNSGKKFIDKPHGIFTMTKQVLRPQFARHLYPITISYQNVQYTKEAHIIIDESANFNSTHEMYANELRFIEEHFDRMQLVPKKRKGEPTEHKDGKVLKQLEKRLEAWYNGN
jgi:hypothetical protein